MFLRSHKQFVLFSFLFVCAFLVTSHTVTACTCGPQPTVLDSFDGADVVVIVRVLSVEKVADSAEHQYVDGVRSTTVVVERVFKGKLKVRDEMVFGQGGGADCIWTFDEKSVGRQILFYLRTPGKTDRDDLDPGLWYAGTCGRSTGLAGATDDLLYLEKMGRVRGKTRVSGTIGGWQNPDLDVEGKKILLIGEKKTYKTKTDKNGVFEIYDLPPRKYLVEPEMPPGWKIDPFWLRYSPSVVRNNYEEEKLTSPKQVGIMLEPKKHAGINIVFQVDNVVRGRVVGPDGMPMHGVCVYLWTGKQEKLFGPSDCTDENGRFEIRSISSGEYVVAVNRSGEVSAREPFRTLYYPNVFDRKRAATITVGPGDAVNEIDIVVPSVEETITVEGVLRYSDGKPVTEERVKFKAAGADKNIDGDVSETTDAAGRFSLKVLKGLTGELAGEVWLYTGGYKNCPKVDELLAKSGKNNNTISSNIIKLETNESVYNLELVLPFPRCEKAKE